MGGGERFIGIISFLKAYLSQVQIFAISWILKQPADYTMVLKNE